MDPGAESEDLDAFEPEVRPQRVSLKLALTNSLTQAELGDYDSLTEDEVLKLAREVKTMHLEWQYIEEISNLDAFDALETLYMQGNRITRIEGLESLPSLQFLALQRNRIASVENL